MITEKNTIVNVKTDNLVGNGVLTVIADRRIKKIKFVVTERKTSRCETFEFTADGETFSGDFKIKNPLVWSVETPELYDFKLSVKYEGETEKTEGSFGFRTIKTEDGKIYLNGKRFYVKGYIRGATAHEHSDNCKLGEKEFYRKNIKTAKEFGFNFVRFHSYIPSDKFFEAADEEGILVHYEFRVPDSAYNNLEEMLVTNTAFADTDKINRLINLYYDHPSLVEYCIGNEIKEGREKVEALGEFIKKTDPSRLYIDTCAWGINRRRLIDIDVQHMGYYFPFGKHADMFDSADNTLVAGSYDSDEAVKSCANSVIKRTPVYEVPLIAHEVCHYTALRDFKSLRQKFAKYGTTEPWWIGEELKMIESKGFADEYADMYYASKYFQKECWKTALEAIRRSLILSGFHFLQFADTDVYENSNGVVDCFDDRNFVTPEEFRRFNGDAVLLADMKSRNFRSGRTLELPITLSNYSLEEIRFADFVYSLTATDGTILCCGEMKKLYVGRKGNNKICSLSLELPRLDEPKECLLGVALQTEDKNVCENNWKIWLYPDEQNANYREFVNYRSENAAVTDDVKVALDLADGGKNVCLVYRSDWTRHLLDKNMPSPEYAFRATWNRFKPVIWDRGTNYGGLCKGSVLRKFGFPTENIYDFNYSEISEDADKIILDDFPVKVNSLITGIDKNVRDRFDAYKSSFNLPELQYEYTLRRFSYLFELKVGKGNLLVCGFNMTGLDKNDPSTAAMAKFILNYISSDKFAPETGLSEKELAAYLKKCAEKPVKERMMTQYWELDAAPVESKEYWQESRKYLTEDE